MVNLSFAQWAIETLLMYGLILAALPWVTALFSSPKEPGVKGPSWIPWLAGIAAGGALFPVVFHIFVQEAASIEITGRVYAALLQVQILLDGFLAFFLIVLKIWPKGGAVAQAAFREGIRQPMFWLLSSLASFALIVSPFVPYFTFGEDLIMVKELGYDTIMLAAVVFGTLAASMFVSEEIEGRTAVTLMSKPVSRRQFLLGKFLGIVVAAFLLASLLFCLFEGVLLYKHWLDRLDPVPQPEWLTSLLAGGSLPLEVKDLFRGIGFWCQHTIESLPGLVFSFCQVMVLVAISVSLATRMPMVVNLSSVLVIYFLAHLTPVLVAIGEKGMADNPDSPVSKLLSFTAQVFDTILPGLEFFRVGPALVADAQLPLVPYLIYILSVAFYGMIYTSVALLFGLVLFEDRDLA
ncbi:MAG: hypothetical protein EXR99_00725 [Gemmataceae bacterium]|nr:hypothetical protein [Gemmataceae bacterium]